MNFQVRMEGEAPCCQPVRVLLSINPPRRQTTGTAVYFRRVRTFSLDVLNGRPNITVAKINAIVEAIAGLRNTKADVYHISQLYSDDLDGGRLLGISQAIGEQINELQHIIVDILKKEIEND